MVYKRYRLSRLFRTNWVSESFFSWAYSPFGLLPPAPKRRLHGEPATVNWGILAAVGGIHDGVHFSLSSYRKKTLFWVVLVPNYSSTPLGVVLFLFCSKKCFFLFLGHSQLSDDIGPFNSQSCQLVCWNVAMPKMMFYMIACKKLTQCDLQSWAYTKYLSCTDYLPPIRSTTSESYCIWSEILLGSKPQLHAIHFVPV